MRCLLFLALLGVVSGCASGTASRYRANGHYTVCKCEGRERNPTPGEASSWRDDERVDVVCEGKVTGCHLGTMTVPGHPRMADPDEPN